MNYYNEFDAKAAAWLRELIKQNLIPNGHVDTRSIQAVSAGDLAGYTQCHFFAGIGGWPLALALAGWPEDKPVWTGSCPCQPFSCAGRGLGTKDPRHLWPVFRRLVGRGQPPIVFGEQVASAAGRVWLAGVRANLARLGYALGSADLCAAGLGAPHIRQRLYWVAHTQSKRYEQRIAGGQAGQERTHQSIGQTECVKGLRLADAADGCVNGGLDKPYSTGRLAGQPAATHTRYGSAAESNGGVGSSCWMGEPIQQGLEGQPRNGDDGHRPGRIDAPTPRPVATASAVGRLAHTRHPPGRAAQPNPLQECDSGSWQSGAWSDCDVIYCRDDKWRRVESGTFPLAHGVSGRVGLLRGYGNAIVPQVAAEFIRAAAQAVKSHMVYIFG